MAFKNPSGYWSHDGSFSVILTDDATTDHVPRGAQVDGHTVRVQNGRVKQVMGGIQLYANDEPFAWGYKYIKEIRDGKNNLLWQNFNYR